MFFRLLLMSLLCVGSLYAQDRSTYRWYFGTRLGLNFNTTPPSILTDGQSTHFEGTSVVCDANTGNLLFYTDGNTIWNRNHAVMATGLNSNFTSSTQSALIVRQPNSSTVYHLFTTENQGQGRGRHFVIDMSLNSGTGGVASSNNTLTPANVTEKLTACRACNGIDYWIIYRRNGAGTPGFYVFRLSPTGLNTTPISSAVGTDITTVAGNIGEMKVSPNGRFVACANNSSVSEVFDFNNATGVVSNPRVLSTTAQRYGLSFSPNSRWLYMNNGWQAGSDSVFRYDMTAANVVTSRQHIARAAAPLTGLGFMELAPDGKIYIARHTLTFLSALNNPDAVNPGDVGYAESAITFGAQLQWGLPNFPQDLFIPDFAGPDTVVCPDQPVRIGIPAVAGYTYSWSPSGGLDNATIPQPTARVSQTTTFTVTATDANSCQVVRDVTVNVRPRPTITLSSNKANNTLCPDDDIQLTATLNGATSVTWQPGNLSGVSVTIRPTASATYRASIVDGNGCTWLDSIAVIVRPRPALVISSSIPAQNDTVRICTGTSVTLSATSGLSSYQWSGGETAPILLVTTAGRYVVTGTDANGCINRDTLVVVLLPLPAANAGRDTAVCVGNTAQLQASGGTTYLWRALNAAPALSQNNIPNPTLSSPQSGDFDYTVQVADANGCVNFDTVRIRINALPAASISPAVSDTALCPCGSLTLSANTAQRYEWYRNTPNQIVGTAQTLTVRDSGSYSVRITDANGCNGFSSPVNVRILPQSVSMRVSVPDSAPAGTRVKIAISAAYANSTTLALCPPDSFTLRLSMNRHPLGAESTADRFAGVISGDTRTLLLSDIMSAQSTYSIELPYTATLGAVDSSIIRIDTVIWKSCPLPVSIINDTFRLAGVCTARGTKQLYNENAVVTMMAYPNPSAEKSGVVIDASTALPGCTLLLSDILGRTVATVYEGRIEKGHSEFALTTANLPEGIYSLQLRTSASEVLNVLVEVRK